MKLLRRNPLIAMTTGGIALCLLSGLGFFWLEKQWSAQPSLADAVPGMTATQWRDASPEQRRSLLLAAVDNGKDRPQARYLLALDYLRTDEGEAALKQLAGLEQDVPVLAPLILYQRGQAQAAIGETTHAVTTWRQLLQQFPQSPVVPEVLLALSPGDPQAWQTAIGQWGQSPKVQKAIRDALGTSPDQPSLMRVLVRYDPLNSNAWRDRLVKQYSAQLTAQDWEIIGDSYWDQLQYAEAARAYAQAFPSAKVLYRRARSLHISNQKAAAQTYYRQLIATFPQAEETGLGLRRFAMIAPPQEAIRLLDQAIAQFPKEAPDALEEKAALWEKQKNAKGAAQAYQQLLQQYPQSDGAAQYRWQVAWKYARQGNNQAAWQWAEPIAKNPQSSLAPQAAFWVGKWAQKLNRPEDATTAFRYLLHQFPESYYSWRAAQMLGWKVGDFNTVRQTPSNLTPPLPLTLPPGGSPLIRELYAMGLYDTASDLLQTELANKLEPTVEEAFLQGALLIQRNYYRLGIQKIWSLSQREDPQDRQAWQNLRQNPLYWQALFPLPYYPTIAKWSQTRQLNPALVAGLIRQESRFEVAIRSSAGATGLMQLMPGTAEWVAQKIKLSNYQVTAPEDNINMGTWYLDYTHREYNNNSILAIASYNAGPGNVSKWVTKKNYGDWDEFIEMIPFAETRVYVESVLENYWNYRRLYDPAIAQQMQQLQNSKE